MSLLAFRDDYQTRLQSEAESTAAVVAADPEASSSIVSLTRWATLVLADPEVHVEPEDILLQWLGPSSANKPIEWCEKHGLSLGQKLRTELASLATSGRAEDLSPESSFVLGTALMEAALNDPGDSEGLTLPFKMAGHLGRGMSWVGAEYRLCNFAVTQIPSIVSEIDAELARWAANPLGQKRVLDSRYVQDDIDAWKSAVGLEQALGSGHSDGMLHTDLATVLMAIAHTEPAFVASRLDDLGHPTVVKAILNHRFRTDESVLLALLQHAPVIADSAGNWNRRFAARLIIDELENRCEQVLSEEARVHRMRGLPEPTHQDVDALVNQLLPQMIQVLLSRPDCALLVSEWIAHLIAVYVGRVNRQANQQLDIRLSVAMVFLDHVGKACASCNWALPRALWNQFGGDPNVALTAGVGSVNVTDDKTLKRLIQPSWVNGRGQRDRVSALLVAIQFATDQTATNHDDLVRWMETVIVELAGEPYLFQLGREQNALLAAYLAWPLCQVQKPSDHVSGLWEKLGGIRLRAKSWPIQETADDVDRCTAIAMIGISAIGANKTTQTSERKMLAHVVSNIVDEIRYSLPGAGLNNWGILCGRLSATLADSGLLADMDVMLELIKRYLGDDEAMVHVLVNMARDPVDRQAIGQVLKENSVDLEKLVERWLLWNRRNNLLPKDSRVRENAQKSEFEIRLLELLHEVIHRSNS